MTDAQPIDQPDDTAPAETFSGAPDQSPKDPTMVYKAVIVGLVLVVVVLGGLLAMRPGTPAAVPAPAATSTPPATPAPDQPAPQPSIDPQQVAEMERFMVEDLPRRIEGDPLAMGNIDAPVVLTEWADYRCPFCSVWAEDVLPGLQRYIDDGTLRVEFRDLAIFGDESIKAATAARAAGEQGQFFEFSHELFSALPNEGHPDIPDELVYGIVADLGLDRAAFEADWADPAHREAVVADSAEANRFRVTSTPSFVIGSQFVSGAQPLSTFEQIIEEQLALHG